jgi:hypothetical protein
MRVRVGGVKKKLGKNEIKGKIFDVNVHGENVDIWLVPKKFPRCRIFLLT